MTDLNDPAKKREEFLKGAGVKMVTDKESFEWFPVVYEGQWAIPRDWEVPANFNPSPKAYLKYKRGGRLEAMFEFLAEARYLHWKNKNGGFDTLKEHERYRKVTKMLGILAATRKPWPYGWKKKLCDALEKGLTVNSACKLVKIPQSTVSRWMNNYSDFRALIDSAQSAYLEKNVEMLNTIAEYGTSEKNRLDAVKFVLERRFKDEYGAKSLIELEEPEAPLDILLGTTDDDEDDD